MNTRPAPAQQRHQRALTVFVAVLAAHWAEHLIQAFQYYILDWPLDRSLGALGLSFPWLVQSEWLHYVYNLAVLVGLGLLASGFGGRTRTWWKAALLVQVWHHLEHLLLLGQAVVGIHLLGRPAPTSVVQLWIPRLELHQFYNAVVVVLVGVALSHHLPARRSATISRCPLAVKEAR